MNNSVQEYIEEKLTEAKERADAPPAIKRKFVIGLTGCAHHVVDLRDTVRPDDGSETAITITFTPDAWDDMKHDPRNAWRKARKGGVKTTDVYMSAQLLEYIYPGTLKRSMPRTLFHAIATVQQTPKTIPKTAGEFFTCDLPERLKSTPGPLKTVSAAYQWNVAGAGVWTVSVDSGVASVHEGPAKHPKCVFDTTSETFDAFLKDESQGWRMFNDGAVTVTNACRARQFMQGVWPQALPRGMPPQLYKSLFPELFVEPSAAEYTLKTEGHFHTYVQGPKGLVKIPYSVSNGDAIFQGDIRLGSAAAAEAMRLHCEEKGQHPGVQGFRIIDWSDPSRFVWPGGIVYYSVQDDAEPAKDVKDAMDHWQEKTAITFQKRDQEPNYVYVQEGDGCSATIGMQGGEQNMTLSKDCSTGNIIHEIGHTVGLRHEHTRQDRDDFVTINWDNIKDGEEDNFEIPSTDFSEDLGDYDYGSIMHYGEYAFSKDKDPTIVTPDGQEIGQRDGLSDGDIAAVAEMYGPRP